MAKMWIVDEFMKRLQEMEKTGDVKRLAELFAPNAELSNLTRQNTHSKTAANSSSASQFWSNYLHAFDHIESRFGNVIDDGRAALMEWHSTGQLPMGLPINYCGVSVIEYSGAGSDEDLKITKFRTYYDSAAFLPHAARSEQTMSQTVGSPEISTEASS